MRLMTVAAELGKKTNFVVSKAPRDDTSCLSEKHVVARGLKHPRSHEMS